MRILFTTISLLFVCNLIAQTPQFNWAKGIKGTLNQTCEDIAVDQNGNVYTTGWFEGTADFDPSAATYSLTCNGIRDMFVTKFDALGNFIWALQMGGTSSDAGNALVINNANDIYITGYFSGTVDLDPGVTTFNATSTTGSSSSYVIKITSAGVFQWAKVVSASGGNVLSKDITNTPNGNLLVAGSFYGSIDFDPSAAVVLNNSLGGEDAFVLSLDINGNYLWSEKYGGQGNECCNAITTSTLGAYVTGYFSGTCNFNIGGGGLILSTAGNSTKNAFAMLISNNGGGASWATQFAENTYGYDEGFGVCEKNDTIYFTGSFGGTCYIQPTGPGSGGSSKTIISNGASDVFIAAFTWQGAVLWAKNIGGTGNDFGLDITTANNGDLFTTGSFNGAVDFDVSATTQNLTSSGSNDVFILNTNSFGGYKWAGRMGGTAYDAGFAICSDVLNNIYSAGYYQANGDFDPTSGVSFLTWSAGTDGYVQKLSFNNVSVGYQNVKNINSNLGCYPNPTNGSFIIDSEKESLISITNILGETVLFQKMEHGKNEIDLGNYANGIYFIKLGNSTFKIVKQ